MFDFIFETIPNAIAEIVDYSFSLVYPQLEIKEQPPNDQAN
jgi:hypothetical protein